MMLDTFISFVVLIVFSYIFYYELPNFILRETKRHNLEEEKSMCQRYSLYHNYSKKGK